jgi:hypothetical protein
MLKWLFRKSAAAPPENQGEVRRRLQAAQRLVRQQKESKDAPEIPNQGSPGNSAREILPSNEPDAAISYRLPSPPPARSTLAAALESILQGRRVNPELFTQLYRGGFVFKDPHGRWAITEMGKGLIERNKLFLPDRCLVAGVECACGWHKQEIRRLN